MSDPIQLPYMDDGAPPKIMRTRDQLSENQLRVLAALESHHPGCVTVQTNIPDIEDEAVDEWIRVMTESKPISLEDFAGY